jgi:hypothetical protein
MSSTHDSAASSEFEFDADSIRELLGYLNFSSGAPDAAFRRRLNELFAVLPTDRPAEALRQLLTEQLTILRDSSPVFSDCAQAQAVIELACGDAPDAYREWHRDLLFYVPAIDFETPFFLACVFEAVLAEGSPWSERKRIVAGAVTRLNDFLGYRPLAVLENGRQAEPYPHERMRPIPLFLRDVGVAHGRYHDIIESTLEFLRATPVEILTDSHFDMDRLDELAMDVRAHDHTHPANKRTNYMFGEWDPHLIDGGGFYRRFVVRRIILDALCDWVEQTHDMPREEALHDAVSVLCGTLLMASSVSGSGPGTHDSTVSLSTLLPIVARQRDTFYARLLQEATGERGKRLIAEAQRTQQPFGHVRRHLNMILATYGARQVQYRYLARLYGRLGYGTAAREQAAVIPSVSARFETDIQWRVTAVRYCLDQGHAADAEPLIAEIEDSLHRGIECGGLVDPWNVLAFQGQFPLFSAREDAIPDQRVDTLMSLMMDVFAIQAYALAEAAARGDAPLRARLAVNFERMADDWDRYATTVVQDLPDVRGREGYESAQHVADALAEWSAAGEAAGDIMFWRRHVDRFQSAGAYARVVDALLQRGDTVAAMGLLMQWLSCAEEVGLEHGMESMHVLLPRWLQQVLHQHEGQEGGETWTSVRRLFDFLEANAGEFWQVPHFEEFSSEPSPRAEQDLNDGFGDDEGDAFAEETELYGAAYDGMVFRDTAADGNIGDTLDGGFTGGDTPFEQISRRIEPRLKFLDTLTRLWQSTAASFASAERIEETQQHEDRLDVIRAWCQRAGELRVELNRLLISLTNADIAAPGGDVDSNIEHDMQVQTRFYLQHITMKTQVSCLEAERFLACCLSGYADDVERSEEEQATVELHRAIFHRDVAETRRLLPGYLKGLSGKPLLYVPFEQGGKPVPVFEARALQAVLRFLVSELPRLGVLRETWHVVQTAHDLERSTHPGGPAVTEFDRLFRRALERTLESVMTSSTRWRSGSFRDEDLIEILGTIVDSYQSLWLNHAETMRLSSVEPMLDDDFWQQIVEFIGRYGSDLFHASHLTLGHVRSILHMGVESYLNHLTDDRDPLQNFLLLDDIEDGKISMEDTVDFLEAIYQAIVDKFDRFLEYNTTTTQSDYGEMFHCLLDFLRLEVEYDREVWNLTPVAIAHAVLARSGRHATARIWEGHLRNETSEMAEEFVTRLDVLEQRHGMRLPSLADHVHERLVKPLALDRLLALVPAASAEAKQDESSGESFAALQKEIDGYLVETAGAGIDVPPWLRQLEKAVDRVDHPVLPPGEFADVSIDLPPIEVALSDMRRQLESWSEPLVKRKKRRGE